MRLPHLLLLAALLILNACAHRVPIEQGMIATPGIKMLAEDRSFELMSGQPFRPPYTLMGTANDPENEGMEHNKYDYWLKHGAKRVLLFTPYARGKVYYGVLALNGTKDSCTGPGARKYTIEVPQKTIAAANDGHIGSVYETVSCGIATKDFTWRLWISDRPLP